MSEPEAAPPPDAPPPDASAPEGSPDAPPDAASPPVDPAAAGEARASAPSAASAAEAPPPLDPSGDVNCPTCGLGLPAALAFCPRCRAAAEGRTYDPAEMDRHERHYVISLVVLSLGGLAIPRLLRSRAFTRGQKLLLGVVGGAQTVAALVFGAWFFGSWFPAYVAHLLHHVSR